MSNFIHIHCHDQYSLLDGFGSPKAYAKRVKELGQPGLAITNHGNIDGLIKWQQAADEEGIVPLFGVELYIVKDINEKEDGKERKHCNVIVKNDVGFKNLKSLLTIAWTKHFYKRARVDAELLLKYCEGLIITSACSSSFITKGWGISLLRDLKAILKGDLYLEVMPHIYGAQETANEIAVEHSLKEGIKLVASNDCHYVNDGDEEAQEVLLAIQTKKKWSDPNRWKFDIKGLYVKSYTEMRKAFSVQKILTPIQIAESLDNTMEIFNKCQEFRIKQQEVVLPSIPGVKDGEDDNALKRLCRAGFKAKILNKIDDVDLIDKYIERLEEETKIIIGQGFCKYFLIVWELIDWCRHNDVMTGPGRGSAGGSLVCYLLGITTVDPIEFKLLFARFISPARIDLPDIDMDFQDNKRYLVVEHLREVYGKDSVAGVSTFMTMKGRGALRDVSRVFDVPQVDVNKAAESIVVRSGGDFRSDYTIEDAFNTFEDGKRFKKKYPKVVEISMKMEGQTRGKGQHAAAVVISSDNLRDGSCAYLQNGSKNKDDLMVNWDKFDIEHVGLMKLDILGLNALTVLNETRRLVKEKYEVDIDYEALELTDESVFGEFSAGHTVGCFQFGSLGLRKLCVELGIDDFMTLVHANALFRPGTLRSGMVQKFVARKRGLEEFEYKHPELEKLTSSTYGIILYQEQVMQFMYDLGGLGWRTADTVRKVMSKSQGVEQFKKFKKMFAAGCVERKTLSKEVAEEIWDELSSFGSYGFNLSHAVEYSVISYYDMWCKVNYPKEFICACLTNGAEVKKVDVIEEAIRLGLDVRPPKVGKSAAEEWVVDEDVLYCPFVEIKGVGAATAKEFSGEVKKKKSTGFFELNDAIAAAEFTVGKPRKKLDAVCAYDDVQITDEMAEEIEEYFAFSFCRNPAKKFDSMIRLISTQLSISKIEDIDHSKIDKTYYYYFGLMTEIRYSYKTSVDKTSDEKKVNAIGGVYGNLKDANDFSMIIFDGKIYNKKKDLIEHCGGKYVLAAANHPWKKTNISCNKVWDEEELNAGKLKGLSLSLANKYKYTVRHKPQNCLKCGLLDECSAPVVPSKGRYNIMILGEAPGKNEDENREGFVGKSGKLLWKELDGYGYKRNLFHLTNVVKCWPSADKTPTARQINYCSEWLEEELKIVKPFLILAFGNTSIKAILKEDGGIMSKSGTCEWIDKLGAWVCWCIHPASVLYHEENMELFQEGIKCFADRVAVLGGIEGDDDEVIY